MRKDRIKKLHLKVAYQLPCASHYTPWENESIDEVLELIGCERVKRKYDRDNQICCGATLGTTQWPTQGKDASLRIRKENIRDAKTAGAEALVMHCPMCAVNLREMAQEAGMKPFMLAELCRLALGEKLPGEGAGLGDNRDWVIRASKVLAGVVTEL